MSGPIPERDWRVLRDIEEEAIDRYCSRGLDEVRAILDETEAPPDDRLFRILDATKALASEFDRTFGTVSRSRALSKILAIRAADLLKPDEFARFSEETRAAVVRTEAILRSGR